MIEKKKKEEKQPLISIIITVKNAEEFLVDCLNSINNQTLKDLEIVAIYAESKDQTLDILKNYQLKDGRLKIYNQTIPGIGAAKNCGIENATGKYITFLDGDDFYLDEAALEKMYNAAILHDVKICGGFRKVLNMNGNLEEIALHRGFLIGFPKGRMFDYRDFQYDYHFHSYIYDREMIINSDARFAETKAYDDTHFHIRAMLASGKFYVVPVELYCYRCHESYSWSSKICYEALTSLIDELKFTKEKHLFITYYIAVQRLNYEYGPQFENHIRNGHLELLELLLEAQKEINNEILFSVLRRMPSSCIFDAMNFPNYDLRIIQINGEDQVILAPLYNLLHTKENKGLTEYQKILENVYESKTYKVGKIILWLPRKILRLLHLR